MVAYKGMKKATKAELAHLARVKEMPCCLCFEGRQLTPTQAHHIVRGKRLGHFFVIPVCEWHHERISEHRVTEELLWRGTNMLLGVEREWPDSKIVQRRVA